MIDPAAWSEPTFLFFAAAVAFVAFLSTSTLGLGSALILTPALMIQLSPAEAVAVVAPATFINGVLVAWVHRREIDWKSVRAISIAAGPTCVLGAIAAGQVPPYVIEIAIGVVIVLALGMKRGLGRGVGGGPVGVVAWGSGAGLVGGLAGTFGPPLAICFLARGLVGAGFVASMAAVAVVLHVIRLPAYVATGLFDPAMLPLASLCSVMAVVAVYAGKQLLDRLDPARFRILVDVVLGLVAVGLLVRAVEGST